MFTFLTAVARWAVTVLVGWTPGIVVAEAIIRLPRLLADYLHPVYRQPEITDHNTIEVEYKVLNIS